MNTLLHRDGDDSSEEMDGSGNREITLGTTVILGIFFALAVLCAVFFGFGYSMGRKSSVAAAPAAASNPVPAADFSGPKPAAGDPLSTPSGKSPSGQSVTVPYPPPASARQARQPAEAAAGGTSGAEESRPVRGGTPPATAANIPAAAIPTGGSTMVQIAAVSHQEDADLLTTSLKRRGYAVTVRPEPQDKLLHVQIGPFPTHKDADAMRQRLLADGFNAIVKDSTH